MKKLFALLLALVMILGLATTAFAAGTDLTITDGSGYTSDRDYKAYRVLDASVDGLNFAYTANAKYLDALLEALDLTVGAGETFLQKEAKVIGAIKAIGSDAEKMRHFADDLYAIIVREGIAADASWTGSSVTLADQGYWLIADVTDLDENGNGEYDAGEEYANSLVMVDTVGDVKVEITNKPDIPVVIKKVDDENDSLIGNTPISEDAVELQDTADYDIGDQVPYYIDVELPNNISEYKYYSFILKDTASAGLTYLPETFEITVNKEAKSIGPKGTAGKDFWYEIDASNVLYVYPAHGYETYDLVAKEANKDNGGDVLKLFPANAAHSVINNSRVYFSYKCLLNENAVTGKAGNPNELELIYSNNPYDDGFGVSKTDINLVLTYKGIFNKVDTDGNPLEGADFSLEKFIAKFEKDHFADQAAADAQGAIDGVSYIYHDGANAWGYYQEVTNKVKSGEVDDPATPENEATTDTTFTFNGLDDGYYRLSETQVPAGFNGIQPIEFRILANHLIEIHAASEVTLELSANSQIAGELTIVGEAIDGSVEADIENRSGTELPHTGGIGTTIFYILGSVLVIGAAVLLVTKKRMNAEA